MGTNGDKVVQFGIPEIVHSRGHRFELDVVGPGIQNSNTPFLIGRYLLAGNALSICSKRPTLAVKFRLT